MPGTPQALRSALLRNEQTRRKLEREERLAIQGSLAALRQAIQQSLRGFDIWDASTLPSMQNAVRQALARWGAQTRGQMGGWSDDAWAAGTLAARDQFQAITGIAQAGIMLTPADQLKKDMLTGLAADLIQDVSDDAIKRIVNTLSLSVLGNKTNLQAMRDIDKVFGNKQKGITYRAERIARTELSRAYNVGNHAANEQAVQAAPELRKRWVKTMDGRVRPDHLAAHGQERKIDEPFDVGGAKLMFPLDPAGPAEQTIGCR